MLAYSKWPEARWTPVISRAIQYGIDFLFSTDPALANYPSGYSDKPRRNWWKFGFPVFHITDLPQNVEALDALGYGDDLRLTSALKLIREKQDIQGQLALEYEYAWTTRGDFGAKNSPAIG
jgi:hypothetical protein